MEVETSTVDRSHNWKNDEKEASLLLPIDFIQHDMIIADLFETIEADDDDPNFFQSPEAATTLTRKQAEDALKTSYQLTKRF